MNVPCFRQEGVWYRNHTHTVPIPALLPIESSRGHLISDGFLPPQDYPLLPTSPTTSSQTFQKQPSLLYLVVIIMSHNKISASLPILDLDPNGTITRGTPDDLGRRLVRVVVSIE